MILGTIFSILMMGLMFRVVGFVFSVAGRFLGGFIGVIGYGIIGILSLCVFGLSLFFLPVIILVGIIAIIAAAVRA